MLQPLVSNELPCELLPMETMHRWILCEEGGKDGESEGGREGGRDRERGGEGGRRVGRREGGGKEGGSLTIQYQS